MLAISDDQLAAQLMAIEPTWRFSLESAAGGGRGLVVMTPDQVLQGD